MIYDTGKVRWDTGWVGRGYRIQDIKNIGYLGQLWIKDNPEFRSKDETKIFSHKSIFCNRESSLAEKLVLGLGWV